MQPMRVEKPRAAHADPLRRFVHFHDERRQISRHRLGQHDRDIVGRVHEERLQREIDGNCAAGRDADLAWRLRRGDGRNRYFLVELQTALPQRLERQISRHQLGEGGRVPWHARPVV